MLEGRVDDIERSDWTTLLVSSSLVECQLCVTIYRPISLVCLIRWFINSVMCCNCFLTNCGYLIFVLISFIINSPLAIFVSCSWYLWWSQIFVHGNKMTAVEYVKWVLLWSCQADVMTLGLFWKRVVFLLINSFVAGSIILFLNWGCKSQI